MQNISWSNVFGKFFLIVTSSLTALIFDLPLWVFKTSYVPKYCLCLLWMAPPVQQSCTTETQCLHDAFASAISHRTCSHTCNLFCYFLHTLPAYSFWFIQKNFFMWIENERFSKDFCSTKIYCVMYCIYACVFQSFLFLICR